MKLTSASQIETLAKAGNYQVEGSPGLFLQVRIGRSGRVSRSWTMRYRRGGKRRMMGLGSHPTITLSAAKAKASKVRVSLTEGNDPIEQRREAGLAVLAGTLSFEHVVEQYIARHAPSWTSVKHADNWRKQMKRHAYSTMGKVAIGLVDTEHVLRVLEPIWNDIPVTAGKLRQRIEAVLDFAKAGGLRTADNPARWDVLKYRFAAPGRVKPVQHRVAVPWQDAPEVYKSICGSSAISAMALRLIILTGVRSDAGRGARAEEFDLDADIPVWNVPPARVKGRSHERKVFRCPLSPEAVELVRPLVARGGLLFRSRTPRSPISDVAVRTQLRRHCDPIDGEPVDVHGWRSTLRDWAGDNGFPREVGEAAIGHVIGSAVERAYRRGDYLEARYELVKQWGTYLTTAPD